jgi:DNA modification methylase
MTMQQMGLLAPTPPKLPASIDLRCADVADVLASIEAESVDLVVADPPWDLYQMPGHDNPGKIYSLLTEEQIGAHMTAAVQTMRRGGRLALWTCWPLLAEVLMAERLPPWLNVPGLVWKSGGSWVKVGRPTCGYHWRSASEPVLLGTRKGGAAGRALAILKSGSASAPEQHSRKPAPWMAEWCRAWVPPGGLVLDLYAGLGSVAEAVVLAGEGRRYIGAEIDPERHATALAMVRRAVAS